MIASRQVEGQLFSAEGLDEKLSAASSAALIDSVARVLVFWTDLQGLSVLQSTPGSSE